MVISSIESEQKTQRQRKEKRILALMILGLSIAIGLGLLYAQHYQVEPQPPAGLASNAIANRLQQECQLKLKNYIEQGGIDIEAKIQYGDMQGCDFRTEQEKLVEQQRRAGSSASLKLQ